MATAVESAIEGNSTREAISFCRICSGGCGVVLTIDSNERIIGVRGDKDSPLTHGYACFKGRQPESSHHGPQRLLRFLNQQVVPLDLGVDPGIETPRAHSITEAWVEIGHVGSVHKLLQ